VSESSEPQATPGKIVNRPGSEPLRNTAPNTSYPFAVVGIVAGTVSLFLNILLVPSIVGFVFGIIGIRHAVAQRTPEGVRPGFGTSVAALVLSAVGAIGTLILFVIAMTQQ
jgi:hypothetical protein